MYADDYAADCYWTLDAPLPQAPGGAPPASADVVIVGAGYTGLTAARETALAGRSTLVLDAGPIGGGCSARNGGQVAFSIKPSHAELAARHGAALATRLYEEGLEAVAGLRALAREERLDFDWRECGCFVGAHSPRLYGALVREAETQPAGLGVPFEVLPRARQHEAIDSPLYHGGVLYPGDASVHPAKLVRALHARAAAAGVEFRAHCEVAAIERDGGEFVVRTRLGPVRARQVLVATNGYTGRCAPWHRRRIIPIGSYIIATEPLDAALVERLIPRGRNIGDTRRVVVYYRPSPDGRRILFGGRAAARETDATRCVPRLRRMLAEVFPELAAVRVSRAWMGFVGFTFDTMPHLGGRDGLYHCLGYCGQGVPSATYYGRKVGLLMAGRPGGESALAELPFPARPFYTGNPWFLPAAIVGYRLRDALGW
ncbi:MAG: FAD-binding oxidoreductase [Proteobacteria bacterium]|nr:FAD-binding oxidoreductase [Pseudomonadota bacterium]